MARTAKRKQQAGQRSAKQTPVAKVYRTAIYARLSREDNLKDSDSIENQINIIQSYISDRPYLSLEDTFIDNGFTGTDFDRPEWQRLMDAIRNSSIDCIIVKDLSRLGRNYIESGELIEKIFPFFKIRFIAISEGIDTETMQANEQLSLSLSNIINDYYAKDISKKVSSAIRTKMENGEYLGSYEKYGYLKSPENKHKLVVNPDTAPIVQMIYQWRSQGMSYMGINKKLNDMGIPSPSQYRANRGVVTNNNQKSRTILWNKHIVTEILKDITYLGHLAQRKDTQCLYAGIPPRHVAEQDWIVVCNTHEPIISQELFDKVQKINADAVTKSKANYGKYDYLPKAQNIYGKKFVCADCGATIKLVRSFSTKKDKVYFTFKCPTRIEHGTKVCAARRITKAEMDEAVLCSIKAQFDLFLDMEQTLNRLLAMKKAQIKQSGAVNEAKELRKKLEQKKTLFAGLYRDLREGLLDEEDYVQTREIILDEIKHLETQLTEVESTQGQYEEQCAGAKKWSHLAERYYNAKEVTSEMVDALIESIQFRSDSSLNITFKHQDSFKEVMQTIKVLRKEVA